MLILLVGCLEVRSALATDISVGVRSHDPTYRELRLAANLGLLDGPLPGQTPLSRAEVFRLLYPTVSITDAEPERGVTRTVAYRMARLRWSLSGRESWKNAVYSPSHGMSFFRRTELTYSDLERGSRADRPLENGTDWRQGFLFTNDAWVFAERSWLAVDVYGVFRADADAATLRFTNLAVRSGWKNLRIIVGREPMDWGPETRGGLLLSNNAVPFDQVRIESDSPFSFFSQSWLTFSASVFAGRLDDPNRADYPNPNLTGMRLTWQPTRWFVLGGTRTVLFGGEGNAYVWTFGSVLDLLLGRNENRNTADGTLNDTDQKGSVDWTIYLWPLLRHVPWVKGGSFYGHYGGEDSPQGGSPLPSAPARTYGLELVAGGSLLRIEGSNTTDDHNLWYWHKIYTDGYTTQGRVMGHPMGGDRKSYSVSLEVPVKLVGLALAGWERTEGGFFANPGEIPSTSVPPILYATTDAFRVGFEKNWGPFPGVWRAEVRLLTESGDLERNGVVEDWGITVGWRR